MVSEEQVDHRQAAGDHLPGSIKRIYVKNFLTYRKATIRPGARLNVVVGANGTGKSSVLNAICLGLGGEPKILGRADDVRDYVRHGEEKAVVEIELAPHPGKETHVIRRVIDKNKGSERGNGRGSSTFYINEEKVTVQDVQTLVSETYQISIKNLCTFLPQDKVGTFSGISPQDLLLETEKTLSGEVDFYQVHQELIEAENDIDGNGGDVETLENRLRRLKHENEQLERERELLEERDRALEQIDLLNKKKLWLEHDALQVKALELKEEKSKMKKILQKAQAVLRPLEQKRDNLVSVKKEIDIKFKTHDDEIKRSLKEMEKQCTKFETHDDQVETIITELAEIDTRRIAAEAEYRKCKERVDIQEEQMKECPSKNEIEKDYRDAMDSLKTKRHEYTANRHELQKLNQQLTAMDEKAAQGQRRVAMLNDDAKMRKKRILQQQPNLAKICSWLDQNRTKFRRDVTGPIACEITPKSDVAAACLEHHVPNNILKGFVVETKEDYNLLYDSVRKGLKLPINIVLVEHGRLKPVKRPYSEEKMSVLKREYGIDSYLDESFDAPDAVRQALQDYAGVHKALLGSEKTYRNAKDFVDFVSQPDASLNQNGLQGFMVFTFSNNRTYRVLGVVSKYSKQISERQDEVTPARMLAKGADPTQKEHAENELAAVHEEMNAFRPQLQATEKKDAALEVETQELREKAECAKQRVQQFQVLQDKWNNAKRKLREAKAKLEQDDAEEKKRQVENLKNRISHCITAMEVHASHQRKINEATKANAGLEASRTALSTMVRQVTQNLDEAQKEHKKLEDDARALQENFTATKQKFVQKRLEAMAAAPILDENNNELPLKATLEALNVTTLEEVEVAIEEAERKANGIEANPDAIRQYEERRVEIETLETRLQDLTSAKAMKAQALHDKRQVWETALSHKLSKVNILFASYMAEMGNKGEISLSRGRADEEENVNGDFKNWGVKIMVSFRDNMASHQLSAQRHSGGERSVSTIMYLMALQDMMQSPFRCVDEINQGLDERNERLVFRRIVENSCKKPKRKGPLDHCGQYFLITPKLLPNLVDMERPAVTVLFVFNGPFNFQNPEDWDMATILGLKKRSRPIQSTKDDEQVEENDENVGNSASSRGRQSRRRRLT